MGLDRIELGKQMQKYADAITAFSVVQALALVFAVAQNARIGCLIGLKADLTWKIIVISYVIYGLIVFACQRAEKCCALDTTTNEKLRRITNIVHVIRICLLLLTLVGLVLFVLSTKGGTPKVCMPFAK